MHRAAIGVLAFAALVAAAPSAVAPDVLVREATREAFAALRSDKRVQAGDERRAIDVVNAKVIPHVDFARFTRLAIGRYWLSATEEQRKALSREIEVMLTRTYVNQIVMMSDKSVEVRPVRLQPGDTDATVKALLKQPGSPPVNVDFFLWKSPQGWKIYDVAVENLSGVQAYRSMFTTEIQRGGIDALLRSLAEKNRGAGTR